MIANTHNPVFALKMAPVKAWFLQKIWLRILFRKTKSARFSHPFALRTEHLSPHMKRDIGLEVPNSCYRFHS